MRLNDDRCRGRRDRESGGLRLGRGVVGTAGEAGHDGIGPGGGRRRRAQVRAQGARSGVIGQGRGGSFQAPGRRALTPVTVAIAAISRAGVGPTRGSDGHHGRRRVDAQGTASELDRVVAVGRERPLADREGAARDRLAGQPRQWPVSTVVALSAIVTPSTVVFTRPATVSVKAGSAEP